MPKEKIMATKKEIIADVNALISEEVSEETLAAVNALLQTMGRKAGSTARPKEIEVDGRTYRYCNRHAQYEPVEWFIVESNGKVKPECAAAFLQWQKYGKEINAAIKAADGAEIGKLTLLRKSKDGYDLDADIETHSEALAELEIEMDAADLPEQPE